MGEFIRCWSGHRDNVQPVRFVHCEGTMSVERQVNDDECKLVVTHIMSLCSETSLHPKQLVVLCGSQHHRKEIRNLLAMRGYKDVKVVDILEYHGDEVEVILICSINVSAEATRLNELSMEHTVINQAELNTMISRAKSLVIIIGNGKTTQEAQNSTWKRVFDLLELKHALDGYDYDKKCFDLTKYTPLDISKARIIVKEFVPQTSKNVSESRKVYKSTSALAEKCASASVSDQKIFVGTVVFPPTNRRHDQPQSILVRNRSYCSNDVEVEVDSSAGRLSLSFLPGEVIAVRIDEQRTRRSNLAGPRAPIRRVNIDDAEGLRTIQWRENNLGIVCESAMLAEYDGRPLAPRGYFCGIVETPCDFPPVLVKPFFSRAIGGTLSAAPLDRLCPLPELPCEPSSIVDPQTLAFSVCWAAPFRPDTRSPLRYRLLQEYVPPAGRPVTSAAPIEVPPLVKLPFVTNTPSIRSQYQAGTRFGGLPPVEFPIYEIGDSHWISYPILSTDNISLKIHTLHCTEAATAEELTHAYQLCFSRCGTPEKNPILPLSQIASRHLSTHGYIPLLTFEVRLSRRINTAAATEGEAWELRCEGVYHSQCSSILQSRGNNGSEIEHIRNALWSAFRSSSLIGPREVVERQCRMDDPDMVWDWAAGKVAGEMLVRALPGYTLRVVQDLCPTELETNAVKFDPPRWTLPTISNAFKSQQSESENYGHLPQHLHASSNETRKMILLEGTHAPSGLDALCLATRPQYRFSDLLTQTLICIAIRLKRSAHEGGLLSRLEEETLRELDKHVLRINSFAQFCQIKRLL